MATTPTRSRGNKDTAPQQQQQQQQQRQDPPKSPSSSARDRKVLSRKILPLPAPRRRIAMNLASSSDVSSASRPQQQQQQHQKLQQGERDKAATEVGGGDADEITAPGDLTTPTITTTTTTTTTTAAAAAAVAEIDNGDGEEVGSNDSAVAESPFLVFSPGMINVRRQGGREGGYKESGLNCSTPTRPKHGSDWIGDLFSRGRLTRSRRTREDALVELDHDNVAQRRLQDDDEGEDEGEDEDEDEEDEDWEGALRGSGGGGSPVTPRSQFGRWKYSIMMSQSTMRPPKLSQEDDAVAVKRSANGEDGSEGGGDSEEDDDGDAHWPFGDADIGSDPSTPKRRPSKIPRDFLMSPTSPSFRDSGCDDNDVDEEEEEEEVVVEEEEEEEEDNGTGADQDAHTTKDESQILKSFSSSQQDQDTGNGHTDDNGAGSCSSTSAIGQGSGMKPPKLNLKHLGGGLPLSPSEISSSFHTPPRKRTRKDLDDFGTVGRPPPAPKLISPEQVLQFFSSSQSPSVLKSLQLRRMDGSFHKRPSNER